ncbi:MAG TPA: retropepsin-like aspartic protease [Burkholderiales bacterium]|nr:retropepsin-like aspartic protease [Burkholderiales bacterium]
MTRIIALLLVLACGPIPAAAADIALIGVMGDKGAVLAIDGGDPKAVKVGQTWRGITVLSIERGQATIEVDGKRRLLQIGQHYRQAAGADNRDRITLAADSRGMFVAEGAINGIPTRFMVDTGATYVGLSSSDAARMGIDVRKGRPVVMQTANGRVINYLVRLDRVRLGGIEITGVDGVVGDQDMPLALLGMSFLSRLEMQRDGSSMTLIRRF